MISQSHAGAMLAVTVRKARLLAKALLVPWILLAVAALPATADDASKAAKVEEFLGVARLEQALDESMNQVMKQTQAGIFQQIFGGNPPQGQDKVEFEEFQVLLMGLLKSRISWEKVKPEYIRVFSEAYSEQQLDDFLASYKSPTGQAMVPNQPEMIARGLEIARKRIEEASPEIQNLIKEYVQKSLNSPRPRQQ